MALRDEVEQLDQEFGKAASNRDLDGVMEFYTADARLLPPGSPMLEGSGAIREFFGGMFESGVSGLELDPVVVDGTEDLVVDVGRYRLTIQPPGADPIVDAGKYIVVYKRQPSGLLRIAYDTFNSDSPGPA